LGRNLHILVIEDDRDVRESLALFLELEGHTVVAAGGGHEALALLGSSPYPHVILIDLNMPHMTGDEFRAAQLADERIAGIPLLVMSADVHADERARAMGASAFLGKPIDPERLLTTLARLFDQAIGNVK
jgi:CheY-like chemotaxis protein